MIRETKFRAKRIDGKGWAVGFIVKTPITAEFNAKEGQYFDSGWEGRWCIVTEHGVAHHIDIGTAGEYAGIKDKNGDEIWEGDIVKQEIDTEYGKQSTEEPVEFIGAAFYPVCQAPSENWEVSGNIHENPELIN